MMTTNLSGIADVKQLGTDGSFRILLLFFRTSWCVGILNSFHNGAEFGTILEGLRNLGGGSTTPPSPRYTTGINHKNPYLYLSPFTFIDVVRHFALQLLVCLLYLGEDLYRS